MTAFGASAPYKELYKHFGITPKSPRPRAQSWARLEAGVGATLINGAFCGERR